MARVYIKFNTAVIKEISLDKDITTFGRKADNDVPIDHPTISGHHCRIVKRGSSYELEDMNSTNGTFVNGHRVKTVQLKHKDQVGVASHILEFHADGTNEPAPTSIAAPSAAAPAPAPKVEPVAAVETPSAPQPAETPATASAVSKSAVIKIVSGGVDGQSEVPLKDTVTYIGTAAQALIKLKGFMAPDLAAAISRRPEGYFLKAVKSGYPKVNGNPVQEQILLENSAQIEVGGTMMIFRLVDPQKAS